MTTTGLLTVPEAAQVLRKSAQFVLRELRAGRLRGSRYGGAWHVRPSDIETYIAEHTNTPAPSLPTQRRRRRRAA